MAANSVSTTNIIDGNITTAKILDANVTDAKLSTITGTKINNYTIPLNRLVDSSANFGKYLTIDPSGFITQTTPNFAVFPGSN